MNMPAKTGMLAGLLVLAGVLLGPGTGYTHPHVFIAQFTRVVFDEKGLAGIKVKWVFDQMFSTLILEDFDPDGNRVLDPEEVKTIKEKAFSYIAPHNYYIHIKIDGRPFAVKFIKDFNASVIQDRLMYEFFIPCHVTALETPKQIIISPYDPAYYSTIYFPDGPYLGFENADHFEVTSKTDIDRSTLIFYETVNPYALFLTFKTKS